MRKGLSRHRWWVAGSSAAILSISLAVGHHVQTLRTTLAASYAQASEIAAQRGDWDAVLANTHEALDLGCSDAGAIQLRRVEAFHALSQPDLARDELQRMNANHRALGSYAGQVLLWEEDVGLLVDEACSSR